MELPPGLCHVLPNGEIGMRVLIVESNQGLGGVWKNHLERLGAEVYLEADEQGAMIFLSEHPVDIMGRVRDRFQLLFGWVCLCPCNQCLRLPACADRPGRSGGDGRIPWPVRTGRGEVRQVKRRHAAQTRGRCRGRLRLSCIHLDPETF